MKAAKNGHRHTSKQIEEMWLKNQKSADAWILSDESRSSDYSLPSAMESRNRNCGLEGEVVDVVVVELIEATP